jgi:hypothetical protein
MIIKRFNLLRNIQDINLKNKGVKLMSTPYEKILNVFHSKFQSKKEIPDGLEEQFFLNALAEFELELYSLTYDENLELIEEDLNRPEINVLGLLMYKEYLQRELDRILKLNNIYGKDVRLTGLGDTKSKTSQALEKIKTDITLMLNKLKDHNFND